MRSFLIRLCQFILLVLGLCALGVWLPDLGKRDSLLYSYPLKHKRLAETASPKIIFIGGSNLLFGLDGRLMQQELGLPLVNMGCHAGLGLRFMLEDVKELVQPGDRVVIVPEYAHFYDTQSSTYDGQDELLTTVLDAHPRSVASLSLDHWLRLLPMLPNYVGNKYFAFFRYSAAPKVWKGYERFYTLEYIDSLGGLTGHLDQPNEAFESKADPEGGALHVSARVIRDLNEFAAAAHAQDARVYLVPSCFNHSSFIGTRKSIAQVEAAWQELAFPVLAAPQRYVFSDSLFWDSPDHLNRAGRDLRTCLMIEDLCRVLN